MKILQLEDGGHLKYEDEGSGRPIVLLHGWGMRGTFFKQQIAAFSPRFRVVAPDLRGHGQSSQLEDGQGLSTLVDDVAELLAELDLSRAIVVGWSMGAMISWALVQHKEARRISALVSIDMVPRILNDESWKFGLRDGRDASVFSSVIDRMLGDWPGFTRFFVPRIFADGRESERQALVDWIVEETENNHPESMARLWMSIGNQDFRNDLARQQLPALVTYGMLSQLYPPEASAWIVRNMPNARRVGFTNSGHAPHLEEPELFNREIETFAEQTRFE
ncbi:MAG: alpha/beta hydrolase [Proteobacteria bacterium]|nr:alpha/beta hydrolase [Pseudomonadota bacterium]